MHVSHRLLHEHEHMAERMFHRNVSSAQSVFVILRGMETYAPDSHC